MTEVLLGVGSNIDRARHVEAGLEALRAVVEVRSVSSWYESAAIGFDGDPFVNLVVQCDTSLSLKALQHALRTIEYQFGRAVDQAKFSARALDIDILTYGDVVGLVDGVQLPRAEILEHAFVLWPLAELVPAHRHPVTGVSYAMLWESFDRSGQNIVRLPS